MSVPDNETFSLIDIVAEFGGVETTLKGCFDNAKTEKFDAVYNQDSYAPANSMLRFRNYTGDGVSTLVQITGDSINITMARTQFADEITIDWGDGNIEVFPNGIYFDGTPHAYASNGTYNINIISQSSLKDFGVNGNVNLFNTTQNPELERLEIINSNLTAVNLSANTKLKTVKFFNNSLGNVDLANNPDIQALYLSGNPLGTMPDLSNQNLYTLYVQDCNLSVIDVTSHTALTYFNCGLNSITEIDISNSTNMYDMTCYYNQLDSAAVTAHLTLLDSFGKTNGKYLSYGQSAPLSEAGITAKNNLISKGWTVSTD